MGLLSSIAAALSEGVGNGMVANAKWGIAEDEQAKKEAAENSRLEKMLAKYDADRESRDKIYAGQLEESKNERLSREEQARLDRENNLKIAGMRDHGGGGNVTGGALKDLDMLDTAISGIDKQIAMLSGELDKEGVTKEDKVGISTQLKNLSSQRTSLINSQEAQRIWSSTGAVGAAHRSMFFRDDAPQIQPGQKDVQQVPPPRSLDGTRSGGLLTHMSATINPGSGDVGPNSADQVPASDLEVVGQHIVNPQQQERQRWENVKAPKGGWKSPIKTKEVRYKNGQKGYTLSFD